MSITLHAPQIIFLVLSAMSLGISLAMDGKPRAGKYSFLVTLISQAIGIGLVYWGGFFG